MGIGIKKEAEQPCRRSLPCHGKVDESITRLQYGIESSWIIGLMETESIGPSGGWGRYQWIPESLAWWWL